MNILWFTWKDLRHPQAGGAELINEEIAKRLVQDGHKVTFVVAGFSASKKEEELQGYRIIRLGNRWSVYYLAWRHYRRQLRGKYDLVIDEINTVPFFASYYVSERCVLFIHQLCREIWWYQIFFPLSLIGYILEPLYLRLLNRQKVVTVSESTKQDLIGLGFKKSRIAVISEGINAHPYQSLPPIEDKEGAPTLLYFGALRAMKRPKHVIKAFEIAKRDHPQLKLWVAGGGNGAYFKSCLKMIADSPYAADILYWGRVNDSQKEELMTKAHLILVPSVREGWGLVVSEANACGTPAIVYDVHGLRDSVKNGETGCVTLSQKPKSMATEISAVLNDQARYRQQREAAFAMSQKITFEHCYQDFLQALDL